ncbi:MAG: acyl-CoA thioesterase [Deltaproteobacteria bacterium]|jgi:acyl-CoA thioester hydrolase|nr:acyl-CoA thioesterase [Deltaproteobacteria bacterium]
MTLTKPLPGSFVCRSTYRVLYVDTDVMGIVNNANYFRFFEQARGDYLRERGFPYSAIEDRGIRSPLTEAWAHFYQPFHYDDLMLMDSWVSQVKKASFMFEYRLYKDGDPKLRVAGRTLHAILGDDGKVVKLPSWLYDILGCPTAA